jgi:hypothetical protein
MATEYKRKIGVGRKMEETTGFDFLPFMDLHARRPNLSLEGVNSIFFRLCRACLYAGCWLL